MTTEKRTFKGSRALRVVGTTLVACTVVAVLYWFVNPFRVPNKLEMLDQVSLDDGKRLLLVQRFNGSVGEPSTIAVYQELSSNFWISYYVNHESSYWRSGRLAANGESKTQFIVYRSDKAIRLIDCETYKSTSARSPQVVSKASIMDQNPLEDTNRPPRSLGLFQP